MVKICENINLKACRIISNVKAKDLAAAVGVTVDTIYKWEKGRSFPNAQQLIKIVKFFAQNGYYIDVNDIRF